MSSVGRHRPTFVVNSKDRENSEDSSSNFFYKLPISSDHEFDSVAVTSIQIPKTYYTLEEGVVGNDDYKDNTFVLTEDGVEALITIPAGNYNIFNFPRVVADALNTASATATSGGSTLPSNTGGTGKNWHYVIEYPDRLVDTDIGKFTFYVSNNSSNQPSFRLYDNRIREMMGLDCDTACTFSGDQLQSTYHVNMQWTDYITVKSNIANNAGNNSQDNAILAVIPVTTVPDSSMINYRLTNLESETKELSNSGNNLFSFALYDDHNRLLNLRGQDWYVQIVLYRQNKYFDIATKSLQIQHLERLNEKKK